MSSGSSKGTAEGDDRSSEETDTTVDNPLFRATEPQRTATFGPAVNKHSPIEERTDATVPPLEPTVPMVGRRRSWAGPSSALAIGALLGLAIIAAYVSCR